MGGLVYTYVRYSCIFFIGFPNLYMYLFCRLTVILGYETLAFLFVHLEVKMYDHSCMSNRACELKVLMRPTSLVEADLPLKLALEILKAWYKVANPER